MLSNVHAFLPIQLPHLHSKKGFTSHFTTSTEPDKIQACNNLSSKNSCYTIKLVTYFVDNIKSLFLQTKYSHPVILPPLNMNPE